MISLREALLLTGGGVISLVGGGGKTSLMFRLAGELATPGDTVLTTTTTKIYPPTPRQSPSLILTEATDSLLETARRAVKRHGHISMAEAVMPSGKLQGLQPPLVDSLWESGIFRWILVEADGAAGRPLKAPASHEPVIPFSSSWLIAVIGLGALEKPLHEDQVFRPERYARLTGLRPGEAVSAASIAEVLVHEEGIMKGCPNHTVRIGFINAAGNQESPAGGRAIAAALKEKKSAALQRLVIGRPLENPPVLEIIDIAEEVHGKLV